MPPLDLYFSGLAVFARHRFSSSPTVTTGTSSLPNIMSYYNNSHVRRISSIDDLIALSETLEVRILAELAGKIHDIYLHGHIASVPFLLGIIVKSDRDQKLLRRLQIRRRVLTYS